MCTSQCVAILSLWGQPFPGQRSRVWFLGANLQYGINVYPKMQLRRNVLFRFEDLLGEHRMWNVIENRFLPSDCPCSRPILPYSVYREHRWPLPGLQFIEFYGIYLLFHLAICQVGLFRRTTTKSGACGMKVTWLFKTHCCTSPPASWHTLRMYCEQR